MGAVDPNQFYSTASRVRTASPHPVSPWPPRSTPRPPSRASHGTQTPVPPEPPVEFPPIPSPMMIPGLYQALPGGLIEAGPPPPGAPCEPLGPVPDTPNCSECGEYIV